MILKLDKKTVLKMIEKYYKEQMDLEGKASASSEITWEGHGMSEHEVCSVFFKIRGKMKLLDQDIVTQLEISEKEVENALSYCLAQSGFKMDSYEFDTGLTYGTVRGYNEVSTEKRPYFNGINVKIKEKVKKMGGQ